MNDYERLGLQQHLPSGVSRFRISQMSGDLKTSVSQVVVFVNYNKQVIEGLKNIKYMESFYVTSMKGYSICYLGKD